MQMISVLNPPTDYPEKSSQAPHLISTAQT